MSARARLRRVAAGGHDAANGTPAFGAYKPAADGGHEPFSLQVIETSGGAIVGLHHFLDPRLFAIFGLPERLEPPSSAVT